MVQDGIWWVFLPWKSATIATPRMSCGMAVSDGAVSTTTQEASTV